MPVQIQNNEARPRIFKLKDGGSFTLLPGVTTTVDDAQWAEFGKTKVKVAGKALSLLDLLEEQGLIEVQGKSKKAAGEEGVSPITTSPPPPEVTAAVGAYPGDGGNDITKRYDGEAPDTAGKKKK